MRGWKVGGREVSGVWEGRWVGKRENKAKWGVERCGEIVGEERYLLEQLDTILHLSHLSHLSHLLFFLPHLIPCFHPCLLSSPSLFSFPLLPCLYLSFLHCSPLSPFLPSLYHSFPSSLTRLSLLLSPFLPSLYPSSPSSLSSLLSSLLSIPPLLLPLLSPLSPPLSSRNRRS